MALLTESGKIDTVLLLIGLLTLFYWFLKHRIYSYWDRRGFKTISGVSYIFGHFKQTFLLKEFIGDAVTRLYNSTSEPFVGIYNLFQPILLVRDPELISTILVKDFQYFPERGVHCNADYDILSAHLFSLPATEWKGLRGKLTPAFSTGKLKGMFATLLDCGSTMQNYLENVADKSELLDVREVSACYTTNIIASVAFGIEVDTINNPNNDFRLCGKKLLEYSIWNAMRWFLYFSAPYLMDLFRIKSADASVEKFLRTIVRQNLEHREKNNVVRKDLFQLLIQLRNTGTVQLDDQWNTVIKANDNQKTMTEEEIVSQTVLFFIAGFETSSTTLSFCLYEIAKNPEIQRRVHDEIDEVLAKHDGKITYESIGECKYLGRCIDETLRLYPVLPALNRLCVKDYQIPGTNNVIEKGTQVFVPVLALQRDQKYYPDPLKFDPNRFSEENSAGKNIYLAFGDGPRNCIAMRLGKLQTKIGLLMMLQKFRYELQDSQKKNSHIEFVPKLFFLSPVGGNHLHVFKR